MKTLKTNGKKIYFEPKLDDSSYFFSFVKNRYSVGSVDTKEALRKI